MQNGYTPHGSSITEMTAMQKKENQRRHRDRVQVIAGPRSTSTRTNMDKAMQALARAKTPSMKHTQKQKHGFRI